jgi:hypothetical protein
MKVLFAAVHESATGTEPPNGDVRIYGEFWRVSRPSTDVANPVPMGCASS